VLFGTGDGLRVSWDIPTTSLPVDTTLIEIRKCDTSTEWTGTITAIEVPAPSDVFVIDTKVMPDFKLGHGYQVRVACESTVGWGPFSEVSAQAGSYSDKVAMQEATRKVQSEGPIQFLAARTDLKGTVERQQIKAMAEAIMREPFPGVVLTGYARPQTLGRECIEDASAKADQRALTVKTALIAEMKRQPKFDGSNLPPIKAESAAYDNQGLRVDVRLATPPFSWRSSSPGSRPAPRGAMWTATGPRCRFPRRWWRLGRPWRRNRSTPSAGSGFASRRTIVFRSSSPSSPWWC
jgi:hypothetical protein